MPDEIVVPTSKLFEGVNPSTYKKALQRLIEARAKWWKKPEPIAKGMTGLTPGYCLYRDDELLMRELCDEIDFY